MVYLFLDFLYSNSLGPADDPSVRSIRGEERARRRRRRRWKKGRGMLKIV